MFPCFKPTFNQLGSRWVAPGASPGSHLRLSVASINHRTIKKTAMFLPACFASDRQDTYCLDLAGTGPLQRALSFPAGGTASLVMLSRQSRQSRIQHSKRVNENAGPSRNLDNLGSWVGGGGGRRSSLIITRTT